jgi:hypothetical protein
VTVSPAFVPVAPIQTGTATFGPIVAGGDVEGWLLDELQTWFSTYLAEVERRHGYSGHDLPRPRSYAIGPSFDKWPEDQLPGILVSSRGVPAPPLKDGEGNYRARWLIEPGVVCSARTQAETHALAMLYGAALRWLVAQRPSLGGNAEASDWIGESYDDLGYDDTRSLYAVRESFLIEVVDVMLTDAGPTSVEVPFSPDDTLPWPPDVEAETVEIELDNVEVTQPLPEEG